MATTSREAGRAVNEIADAITEMAGGAERQVRLAEAARHATDEVVHSGA